MFLEVLVFYQTGLKPSFGFWGDTNDGLTRNIRPKHPIDINNLKNIEKNRDCEQKIQNWQRLRTFLQFYQIKIVNIDKRRMHAPNTSPGRPERN